MLSAVFFYPYHILVNKGKINLLKKMVSMENKK